LNIDDPCGSLWIYSPTATALKSTIVPYSSQIEYDPKDAWSIFADDESGNWMTTNTPNASASLTFTNVRAVAIHSPLILGHSTYALELDDQLITRAGGGVFNASIWWWISDSLLFFKDGLDPGQQHTIRLLNTQEGSGVDLTVRSFEVWQVEGTSP